MTIYSRLRAARTALGLPPDSEWAKREREHTTARPAHREARPAAPAETGPKRPSAMDALDPGDRPRIVTKDEPPRHCHVHGVTWRGEAECWAQDCDGVRC